MPERFYRASSGFPLQAFGHDGLNDTIRDLLIAPTLDERIYWKGLSVTGGGDAAGKQGGISLWSRTDWRGGGAGLCARGRGCFWRTARGQGSTGWRRRCRRRVWRWRREWWTPWTSRR